MAEGNGVDLRAIYQLLLTISAELRNKADRSELIELRTELKADMQELRQELRQEFRQEIGKLQGLHHEVAGVRQAITQYHASVLGHGILISELEARMRRVEDHLNLPPLLAAE